MSNLLAIRALIAAAVAMSAVPGPPPAPVERPVVPLVFPLVVSPLVPPVVPLVVGLTVVTAVSNLPLGDYESIKTITGVSAADGVTMTIAGDVPTLGSSKTERVFVTRHVLAVDLKSGRSLKFNFTSGDQPEFPGTTAISTSAVVIADIRSRGKSAFGVNGEGQGIAGLVGAVFSAMSSGNAANGLSLGPNASGTLAVVEHQPVSFAVLLNGARVTLQAWHLKGLLEKGDNPVGVECWILDDPNNPLMLRYVIDKQALQVVRIDVPSDDNGKSIERALSTDRRAVLYGVYFDFNSAELKPQSEVVLKQVADMMQREPSWKLRIEGHTDSVGGDAAANKVLSAHRAEAVKAALVERGVASARLDTQGFGASTPRESNNTLQGRARNRRVELTRE